MPSQIAASDIHDAGSRLVASLGGHWHHDRGMCRCPAHSDRKPSLSVRVGDHSLLFKCFAGCDTIDVLRAIRALRMAIPRAAGPAPAGGPKPEPPNRRWALKLWGSASAITGGVAARYLGARGLTVNEPALRYHPRTPLGRGGRARYRPAIIAAIREGHDIVAIQRLFLELDGLTLASDLADARRTLGSPLGGAVPFGEPDGTLCLAEGVETAMSARTLLDMPVWATLGAERFHQIAIPASVRRLILLPDSDRAGRLAVLRSREAYARAGMDIETWWPWGGRKDWNDVLLSRSLGERRGSPGSARPAA